MPSRAEISRRRSGPLEAIRYARQMPYWEQPPGLGRIGNELLGALPIPLPEDFSALAPLARNMMGASVNDPGAVANMRAGLTAIPGSMLRAAVEHPVTALAAAFGPQAGIGAYQELTPLPIRAYLHSYYGQGRPMTYLNAGDRAAFREVTNSLSEGSGFRYPAHSNTGHNVKVNLAQEHGISLPPNAAYVEDYAGPWRAWMGAGKFFVDDPYSPTRILDEYRFYPEAQADNALSLGALLKKRAARIGTTLTYKSTMTPNPSLGSRLSHAAEQAFSLGDTNIPQAVLEWLGSRYSKPFPIDASIRP